MVLERMGSALAIYCARNTLDDLAAKPGSSRHPTKQGFRVSDRSPKKRKL